ncbi:MAG: 2Fe-2S iron-sulfur cluster binding domain-containing protein [Sulfuricella sp.]|nr:2Fe-2S iron-sulfur cluster binding domain-containing protein [Sulfuricella sp.]
MSQFLSISRAARLVGVTRTALQKKIKDGELASFDGTVTPDDLLRVYPQTQFEDNSEYERITQIKEKAFGKRVFERALPDKEVLAARIADLSKQLAEVDARLKRYDELLQKLSDKLGESVSRHGQEVRAALEDFRDWLTAQLDQGVLEIGEPNPLAARDNVLRVMAAHVQVQPSGHEFFLEGHDTLLEAALRAGVAFDYGCSNGNCGRCKARVVSGQIKKVRSHDFHISEPEIAQGYLLMCSNTAVSDVVLEAQVAGGVQDIPFQQVATKVKSIEPLGADHLLLHLQTPRTHRLRFLAGQHATLHIGKSLSADLPIASCPCDERNLHFHVRRLPGNVFSDYVFGKLKPHDTIDLEGPQGEFILSEKSARPLIFIAFDDGFAPLKSLIEHAMALETGNLMHLYWIASSLDNVYLPNIGRAWSDALDEFRFTPMVVGMDLGNLHERHDERLHHVLQGVVNDHPDLLGSDIYLAGPEIVVTIAERYFLAQGLPKTRVFAGIVG